MRGNDQLLLNWNCPSIADLSNVSIHKTSATQCTGVAQQTGCGRVHRRSDCACRKWRQKPSVACLDRPRQPT